MIHEKKLLKEGIKETLIPGLKIIVANTDLAAAEVELTNFENREFVFKSIFDEIDNFDFIFCRLPTSTWLANYQFISSIKYNTDPPSVRIFCSRGSFSPNANYQIN